MTTPTSSSICSTCQNPISADELAQGLAVKVDGEFVCQMCVDSLPGKAQVEINRFRALKGLNATTYAVPDPRHPHHQRFSFTTATNVLIHRRTLRDTGSFTAPPLPETAPRAPSSTANRAVSSTKTPTPPPAPRALPKRQMHLIAGASAGACIIIVGALWAFMRGPQAPSAPATDRASVSAQPLPVVPRLRAYYPREPLAAWRTASVDPRCPDNVLEAIVAETTAGYDRALDALAMDLDQGRTAEVGSGLDRLAIIDDPRFASSRARAEQLRTRLTANDPRVAPDLQPSEEPPVEEPDPPAIAHPSAPPAPECWLFSGTDLIAGRKVPFWKANAELSGLYGTIERALPPLEGGTYQLWVQVACATGRGSLTVLIDGEVVGKVSGADCVAGAWHPLNPALVVRSGATGLTIKATSGPGWRIDKIYLAGSDRSGPDGNPGAVPPPWPPPPPEIIPVPPVSHVDKSKPASAEVAKPVPSNRAVTDWKRVFVWPPDCKPELLDGTADLPSPWPSGADPFQRSQRPPGAARMQLLEIELAKASVAGGGVVVLLHRVRSNRKSLNVWIESSIPAKNPKSLDPVEQVEHLSIALEPLKFSEAGDWQVFPIAFPDIERFGSKLWLKFEDASDLGADRGFLLGKVVTVANTPPEIDDIELLSAPLVGGDIIANKEYQHNLVTLLDQAAAHRPSKKWSDPKLFDPRKIKLLVTNADKNWETAMRKDMAGVFGREAPTKVIENLGLSDSWFTDMQFKPTQPLLTPEECTMVVLVLNGEETTCSLKDPDNLVKWMRTMITEVVKGDGKARRGGFLPVLVIGRTTKLEDPARAAAIDAAWPRVREDCANLAIPLIDIRHAQQEALKHYVRDVSSQLLADGLRNLVYQISWMQKKYVR